MAQHYPIRIEQEEKVRKSLLRIGSYIKRNGLHLRRINQRQYIYSKQVVVLPEDYKLSDKDEFVISIGVYQLPCHRELFPDYWKEAHLECHFDKNGQINTVYFPL